MNFFLAASTPIQIDVTIVLQTVTAILLAAGLKWVLNLKSVVEVMQAQMLEMKTDVLEIKEKATRHADTAHVHPAQFESMRDVVNKMSEKMTLIWHEFEKANRTVKLKEKEGRIE